MWLTNEGVFLFAERETAGSEAGESERKGRRRGRGDMDGSNYNFSFAW